MSPVHIVWHVCMPYKAVQNCMTVNTVGGALVSTSYVHVNKQINKNTLGAKKWCGQEKQQLKGVIWECGQDDSPEMKR